MVNEVKSPASFSSPLAKARLLIQESYRMKEAAALEILLKEAKLSVKQQAAIEKQALNFILALRKKQKKQLGIETFLAEYGLSTEEGTALMCLAEALLRIPDKDTRERLIQDKLNQGHWAKHHRQSSSFFVNALTWSLMLAGKILDSSQSKKGLEKALQATIATLSKPLLHRALSQAMQIMSQQFVMGQTIEDALNRAKKREKQGFCYSYDMLGEAALTKEDAELYYLAYKKALEALGERFGQSPLSIYERPGLSIKLSAIEPRYQEAQRERVLKNLAPKLLILAQLAKRFNLALTIDAEEAERLELSLDLIEQVFMDQSLKGWDGFGLAVQAYQKRAFYLIDWVYALAKAKNQRMMLRLTKGAYWDSEIKRSQILGLQDYPVFTYKAYTDLSYQACTKKLLKYSDWIYPQFATHNAYTLAMVLILSEGQKNIEFQCLHGMGLLLYEPIVNSEGFNLPCRIYAPVGNYESLLPYLIRRLLENGANASFVHRMADESIKAADLVEDPVEKTRLFLTAPGSPLPLPSEIFLPLRKNAFGLDLSDRGQIAVLEEALQLPSDLIWQGMPKINDRPFSEAFKTVTSPQNKAKEIGQVRFANEEDCAFALEQASKAFASWSGLEVSKRALCLEKLAILLEKHAFQLLQLLCWEAGKTWSDALSELREAIDFCYYYAAMAKQCLEAPMVLKGYTGELNELSLKGLGSILCISPWNFPLAIFTGQVLAALVAGNVVLAKPAEQTSLIATYVTDLIHEAGVPPTVMQLLPGKGEEIGAFLVADQRIKAILFTGSTKTAALIQLSLAKRGGPIIPFIAETGGQNAMLVDASAHLEQVTMDVLLSAFGSAGQRCSSLRVLYLQEEIYERALHLIKGAMAELRLGDPSFFSTDLGPVIDKAAYEMLHRHLDDCRQKYQLLYQCPLTKACNQGFFIPPSLVAIPHISVLTQEFFGPILHVIPYSAKDLAQVITQVNSTGYGLTFGVHSRINETIRHLRAEIRVGNFYVNRNMIGAVVGLQPFGGEGRSGTGPKAGGPFYLLRLCHERTFTQDTTAVGGNVHLLSLPEGDLG